MFLSLNVTNFKTSNLAQRKTKVVSLFHSDLQDLFPEQNLRAGKFTVITLSQRTDHDMSIWSVDVEEEREILLDNVSRRELRQALSVTMNLFVWSLLEKQISKIQLFSRGKWSFTFGRVQEPELSERIELELWPWSVRRVLAPPEGNFLDFAHQFETVRCKTTEDLSISVCQGGDRYL